MRSQVLEVASVFHADVVDMGPDTLVLEAAGSPGKLDALLAMLSRYGPCELVRTGRIALAAGSATITDAARARSPTWPRGVLIRAAAAGRPNERRRPGNRTNFLKTSQASYPEPKDMFRWPPCTTTPMPISA